MIPQADCRKAPKVRIELLKRTESMEITKIYLEATPERFLRAVPGTRTLSGG
jgi:hypothetical protein